MNKSDERRWQAEEDASTMARYQEIMGDKTRMNRAIKVAQARATDLQQRANAMSSVANSGKRTTKKGK